MFWQSKRCISRKNVKKLAAKYPGKYLLIKGTQVYGAYETFKQGVEAGSQRFGGGSFLVRSVSNPDDPPPFVIPNLITGVPFVADL